MKLMNKIDADIGKQVLSKQQGKWEETFRQKPDMFGEEPSEPVRKAAELYKKEGKTKILELGAGQGRDTIFLAQSGFHVYALDYSETALISIDEKARRLGLITKDRKLPPWGKFVHDVVLTIFN